MSHAFYVQKPGIRIYPDQIAGSADVTINKMRLGPPAIARSAMLFRIIYNRSNCV